MSDIVCSLDLHVFPILVTDEKFTVTAKNSAAKYFFKDIRIGSSLLKKASFSECGKLTLVGIASPFKNGIFFPVERGGKTENVILFLLGIQSGIPEDAKMPESIGDLLNIADGQKHNKPDRLYGELAEFVEKYRRNPVISVGSPCNMAYIKQCVDECVAKRFRSLGYRAEVSLSDIITTKNYFFMNAEVLLCTLAELSYMAMRASSNGAAGIEMDFDKSLGAIAVTACAKARGEMTSSGEKFSATGFFPECATEIELLERFSSPPAPMKFEISNGIFTATAYIDAVPSEDLILGAASSRIGDDVNFYFDIVRRELKRRRS